MFSGGEQKMSERGPIHKGYSDKYKNDDRKRSVIAFYEVMYSFALGE